MMKRLSKYILIVIAALGFWSCHDEPDMPLEVFPGDMNALKEIYTQLRADLADYPSRWSPEDKSTWKNAGIELDTIIDEENQMKYLAISSITLYLPRIGDMLPTALLDLSNLKDLKIYGYIGTYFHGDRIPSSVESLLVDRLSPEFPGYIVGVPTRYSDNAVIIGDMKPVLKNLIIHSVDMKCLDFMFQLDANIDLSHNTLEGDIPYNLRDLSTPANMSYNRYTGLQYGWSYWKDYKTFPIVQYNLIDNIPQDVLQSDFWKENHEKFIGNPGYVAPQP